MRVSKNAVQRALCDILPAQSRLCQDSVGATGRKIVSPSLFERYVAPLTFFLSEVVSGPGSKRSILVGPLQVWGHF
jgi:hypothetical protein